MRVSCMSPLSARFRAILCNSGKIGEAVPKKPPKKSPDPGPSGCFQAVEIPFPHRGTHQRTAKVQPGFHPFPPDSGKFHLSAMARRIVGKGHAGALRGVCKALARAGHKSRAARRGPAGKSVARKRRPGSGGRGGDSRSRARARPTRPPGGAAAQGGFTRRSGNRQPEGRRCVGVDEAAPCPPAVCPLWRDPQKGGIWKGGFQRGKTEGGNGVAGAARRVEHPPFRGLGGENARGASGAARSTWAGPDGMAGRGPAMCGRRIGRLWPVRRIRSLSRIGGEAAARAAAGAGGSAAGKTLAVALRADRRRTA